MSYKQEPPDLIAAGEKAAQAAREAAETCTGGMCKMYGIGVCTSLAAAGQRLLGLALAEAGFVGARVVYLEEQYYDENGKKADGHEYLLVTDADGSEGSKVLVDYWYAAMNGEPSGFILSVVDAKRGANHGLWNFNNVRCPKDHGVDRVYIVPPQTSDSGPSAVPPSCAGAHWPEQLPSSACIVAMAALGAHLSPDVVRRIAPDFEHGALDEGRGLLTQRTRRHVEFEFALPWVGLAPNAGADALVQRILQDVRFGPFLETAARENGATGKLRRAWDLANKYNCWYHLLLANTIKQQPPGLLLAREPPLYVAQDAFDHARCPGEAGDVGQLLRSMPREAFSAQHGEHTARHAQGHQHPVDGPRAATSQRPVRSAPPPSSQLGSGRAAAQGNQAVLARAAATPAIAHQEDEDL
eukprot:3894204-Prymnesium_polylepis.1